jgi:hypothetical protein
MYFDYRIVRKVFGKRDEGGHLIEAYEPLHVHYGIHEVTYDENSKMIMVTQDAISPYGDTVEDLMHHYSQIADAFTKPIVDFDDIPEEGSHNPLDDAFEELQDEDGNMRPTEELEAEGKVVRHEDVMEALGLKDFDRKEFANQKASMRNQTEREYKEKFDGLDRVQAIQKMIEEGYGEYEF